MAKRIRKYLLARLRLGFIIKLVKRYPNDTELGMHVRKYIDYINNIKNY